MMTFMKKNRTGHLARLCMVSALLCASGARADCAGDFARDNAFKPEAGAVRMHERKLPMSLLDDGRWVPTLRQETVNTVSELVPPNAVRVTSDALYGMVGLVVLGDKGWIQDGRDGPWETLDAAESHDVAAGAFKTYLTTDGMSDLTCSKQERDGKPVRVYRYQIPGDGFSSSVNTATAYFDDATGLLVGVDIEGSLKKSKVTQTLTITFDDTIKIQPPDGID
jgi:hypothetical protein